MKKTLFTLLVSVVFTYCSPEDGPDKINQNNLQEENNEFKISPSRIKIGEIGDTIRITGTGLDKIKRVEMKYEGTTDDFDGSFEFGLSGAPFIRHTDKEILIKPDYFPEYYKEDITLYLKDAEKKVVMKAQLEVYGLIPIKQGFSNVRQIEVSNSQVAYVLDDNKVIYKSSDGYNEWEEIFSSGHHIVGMQFIDARIGWVVVDEGMYSNIYITNDGGSSFEFYFPKDVLRQSIWKFQFTSINRGYFNTTKEDMFVINDQQVFPFYDFFNDLNITDLSTEKVSVFRAVNDNLIFIKPQNSESLVRISEGTISQTLFGEFYNMPDFFGSTGYFAPFWRKLYKSTDYGESWEEIKEFDLWYLNAGFLNKDLGFAINIDYNNPTDIYFTDDAGASWIKYYRSAGRFDAGRLFDFTSNSGLFADPRMLYKYVP